MCLPASHAQASSTGTSDGKRKADHSVTTESLPAAMKKSKPSTMGGLKDTYCTPAKSHAGRVISATPVSTKQPTRGNSPTFTYGGLKDEDDTAKATLAKSSMAVAQPGRALAVRNMPLAKITPDAPTECLRDSSTISIATRTCQVATNDVLPLGTRQCFKQCMQRAYEWHSVIGRAAHKAVEAWWQTDKKYNSPEDRLAFIELTLGPNLPFIYEHVEVRPNGSVNVERVLTFCHLTGEKQLSENKGDNSFSDKTWGTKSIYYMQLVSKVGRKKCQDGLALASKFRLPLSSHVQSHARWWPATHFLE
ncbi:hypothetical protein HYDPIDRAFT_171206 [Hydnomerulius pinastri MD-312]|uniref:Uncharacterized protein n=1 Tax=Hydnomerulius pinastri MD-312 TaxID=994086 RepID=A0A0C9W7Y2_9AGAM|nr:hypothetical protein HYDPIDRAFT_171206 [Hydnomerulius pinastri MD-312]